MDCEPVPGRRRRPTPGAGKRSACSRISWTCCSACHGCVPVTIPDWVLRSRPLTVVTTSMRWSVANGRLVHGGDGGFGPARLAGTDGPAADRCPGEPWVLVPAGRHEAGPTLEPGPPAPANATQVRGIADGAFDHHCDELGLARHVAVQRHLGEVEALGHPLHRDSLDTFGICRGHGCVGDPFHTQGALRPPGGSGPVAPEQLHRGAGLLARCVHRHSRSTFP